MFKIMKGLEVVEWEKDLSTEIAREHNLSYNRKSDKSRKRNDFAFFAAARQLFVNRVFSSWDVLP